ncbi:MAG: GH92 family glycosyl hydrolase, partial [Chitinophagaceae bacterium]|nr:GH92 family glycosyl hydrolase [Chitinophagaceae bacterium]
YSCSKHCRVNSIDFMIKLLNIKERLFRSVILLMTGFFMLITKTIAQTSVDLSQHVNPFIGTSGTGHTFPGACVPFGLIQAGPETGNLNWRYCAGYNVEDDSITGFTQTRLNGTGVPDLGDIRLFPFQHLATEGNYKSLYNKQSQKASPGFYTVDLKDVNVQISATEHTSFHQYHFSKSGTGYVLLDLQSGLMGAGQKIEYRVKDASMNFADRKTITGSNEVKGWVGRKFFYVIQFDQPYKVKETIAAKEGERAKRVVLEFDLASAKTVKIKIGLSVVDIAGALASLKAESSGWDIATFKANAKTKWNELLSRAIISGDRDQKTNFYTSLYRLFIQPNNIADLDGRYRGANDSIAVSPSKVYYSTFSLWDTYRAAHPLYTLLAPDRVDGMIQTMLTHQEVAGILPIWTLWGKENYCMIGNHAIPVIADAYLKGFRGFDAEKAFAAIKTSSIRSHLKSDWETYNKYGYYPFDSIKTESVSRTLESAFDDYSAAQMAKALGKTTDYNYFTKRSNFYKNLLDPETHMMRGKDSKGHWRTPFNVFSLSHSASHGGDYTEGNAWQYTWQVQHDAPGLINMMGGKNVFAGKLDTLFTIKSPDSSKVLDVTGLIGQYAHGNEPSHHVIYWYNYAGQSYKTQELIRSVFDQFYLPKPDGLCGNDDCGQMSAWYVFSAMGFYPANPVGGEYLIGAPQIPQISLSLPGGKTFLIEAKHLSTKNKYVASVSLNGKLLNDLRIQHADIVKGGKLVFTMTDKPVTK